MKGYDCIIIPNATKKSTLGTLIPGNADEFCGRALATITSGTSATVCCNFDLTQVQAVLPKFVTGKKCCLKFEFTYLV